MRKLLTLLAILSLAAPLAFYGCGSDGSDGSNGTNGTNGTNGINGTNGTNGINGTNGTNGINGTNGTNGAPGESGAAKITDKHGAAVALAEELGTSAPATVVITGATANVAGLATVTFTVKNAAGASVTGLGAKDQAASFSIASLAPAGGGFSYNMWVSYIWRASGGVNQAYRERPGVGGLVEGPSGTYTYTFVDNLAATRRPADNVAITYDRTRTHRVFVALRGTSTGYVGGNTFDFVPAGGAVAQTRDIVEDATCRKCHMNTPGHYGPWNGIVKACVICHSPGNTLANTAPAPAYDNGAAKTLEMSVMLHRIHAGSELQSIAGLDGQYYDNPNTAADEKADNGPLYLLGSQSSWNTAAFPAVLANCQACHTQAVAGTLAQVDNWRTVPSRAACGSCHDLINWTSGVNHPGGPAANDTSCALCHPSTGTGFGKSVTVAHNWSVKDARNIPEFNVTITTDTPARGYYIAGESPVISIVLRDAKTNALISPASVIEDPTAEGCTPVFNADGTVSCAAVRDGLFRSASMYVAGPRAQRLPVLSYGARAAVRSTSVGPWNLSAGGNLGLIVDGGKPLRTYNNDINYEGYGADELISGAITVPFDNSFFPDNTAATPAQVAAWLNANVLFHERAVAYVDEALAGNTNAGRLAIRSRGVTKLDINGNVVEKADQPSISIVGTGPGGIAMFANNVFGAAGTSVQVRKRSTANATDPRANFTDNTAIRYTLDPVDDLVPGTYVINVEFADAGRGAEPAAPAGRLQGEPPYTNYVTPSVAVKTFQVKQSAAEAPVAFGCGACHWSDAGTGFVLDYPRHNKPFTDNAIDQCANCHEYHSAQNPATVYADPPGSGGTFGGAHPISKRVHAVHYGSNLTYPTVTVAHEETADFGRNWNITYPMNILNCESCHSASKTSGSWKTNPNRLACMGCHDSDAATGHMRLQTYDPTPLAPFSGDEWESCKACH